MEYTNADMMIVFDVIIAILGIYIIFMTYKMKKEQEVPGLFVAPEEMNRCRDKAGFINFLTPRGMAFGVIATAFGAEGIVNDLIVQMSQIINVVVILLFIVAWVWFSKQLRKGKELFF